MSATKDDGGPALPCDRMEDVAFPGHSPMIRPVFHSGMTLRDWFARNTPSDEVTEMTFKHLSRLAQEKLAGMKCPEIDRDARGNAVVDQQIAVMAFNARVNAALRYISADAMLAARKENP